MRLRTRVLLLYFCILILVLFCIGIIIPSSLHEQNLVSIREDSIQQLKHIDFALSNFFKGAGDDVAELLMHKRNTDPDDTGFTSFLNASEETFQYHIDTREQEIVDDFNAFRLTHPYVNSVYMGRESGTFVRSHPRPLPTAYDPRERPWYVLAKANPTTVMRTDPYRSVTSPDINIGIVKAIAYPNGTVYGVLGADITLINLTDYISSIEIRRSGEIMLINETGTILASRDQSLIFTQIQNITRNQTDYLLKNKEGIITLPSSYLIFYTSPMLGWKLLILIPYSQIESEILGSIMQMLLFILFALILLSVITIFILDRTIIRPISSLKEVASTISETGNLDQKIDTSTKGEIGDLASSFSLMIEKIKTEKEEKNQAFLQVSSYRDHLEELVHDRTVQLEEINAELLVQRDRAEQADQLKSAFLATMSHELRTPLNSIIGFTGILLQKLAGPLNSEQEKQLTMVQQSARHLLALINDVLDISKIEAGELNIVKEPVDILSSIQSAINLMKKTAEEKGLELMSDLAPDTGSVIGDKRRIEQVMLNLLSNAIKFTDTGSITVTSSMKQNMIRISIKDTGIGIEKEKMDILFKPFHQIDTGTTRKHEGTGLGLSISKKLIELHGGSISVTSEIGEGSEFVVLLPGMVKT
ncbi:ATP-binding protein [uncultured Methanospirillum sp.]|uniref:sensor histidine kinase n=1 Tax=uncultured Methanospirillum sp. TaxID=262503 RepID=UPI0029C68A2C|nr:ATP-binding protein [uncultured Methanospirillum sp.]